ncbi:uncharacterized protein LOC132548568 [Ylistrum balloti]|uniref:uncharacterized protein LOC132548568 n=1 Tax=Ylistrum balloti TaxID=509963 RepID=UPI002905D83A|nr:uncharacterized protein LOC132548568 [Ylistrum balloti]
METRSTANEKTVLLTNEWPIGTISREDINEETNITGNETNYPQRHHPTVKTGENSQTETPPLPVDTEQASSRLQTTNENVSQEDGENRGEEQRVSQPAKVETGVPVVGFMGGLGYPLTGAMLSGVTSPDKQGFLFSLLGLVESAGTLCSGLGLNTLYSSTVGWMKGFVFLLSAVLCLLCVPLYMYCLVASRVRVDRANDIKTDQS